MKLFKKQIIFIFASVLLSVFLIDYCDAIRFIGNPGSSTLRILGPNVSNVGFTTSLQTITTIVSPGGITNSVIQDLNAVVRTYPTILTEGQVSVQNNLALYSITFSSLDPTIGTVDSNGVVTRVSNGTVRVLVSNHLLKKAVNVPVALSSATPVTTYTDYADGTLGKNVSDGIDDRITGVTSSNASTYKPIFSTQNHASSIYVRNTSCWAYGLDLTSISPWNSYSANLRAGTLISPRHIIFANHYTIPNGTIIRFVTSDNVVVERTLTSSARVGSTDIRVGVLSSDVPDTISFAKLLPSNWESYMPNLSKKVVTAFYTDQQEKALVNVFGWSDSEEHWFFYPSDIPRTYLFEALVDGDSGNPAFLIINNQLVILTAWHFGGAGAGPNFANYRSSINTVMTSLGGGYQTTEIDLSSFSTYSAI